MRSSAGCPGGAAGAICIPGIPCAAADRAGRPARPSAPGGSPCSRRPPARGRRPRATPPRAPVRSSARPPPFGPNGRRGCPRLPLLASLSRSLSRSPSPGRVTEMRDRRLIQRRQQPRTMGGPTDLSRAGAGCRTYRGERMPVISERGRNDDAGGGERVEQEPATSRGPGRTGRREYRWRRLGNGAGSGARAGSAATGDGSGSDSGALSTSSSRRRTVTWRPRWRSASARL